jgi:HlyD family secretion protein
MRRLFKWVVILGVLAGLGLAAVNSTRAWLHQRAVPRYATAPVSRGRVETVVNSTGTVKPVLSVSVGAFTSGPIKEVNVDFNSVVKKGDLLALIDPQLAQAALRRDQAALDAGEAALKTQKADLARVEALLKQAKNNEKRARDLEAINKDYISVTDLDQFKYTREASEAQVDLSRANVAQAEANVKQSEANVANSRTNLGYTEIRSPVDGIVIERKVDPGQTVAASFQTPELFIIAPGMEQYMYVFATVDEADIGQVRAAQERGRPVRFTVDSYPGDLFEGVIHQIRKNSTTTQNVVTYPVIIKTPNPELKLLPGMTANLSFLIESKEDVPRLPGAALRFVPPAARVRPEDRHYVESAPAAPADTGGKKSSAAVKAEQARKRHHRVVWVQDGDSLRAVPVTLGLIENQFAEIVEGDLSEGQAVVTGTE